MRHMQSPLLAETLKLCHYWIDTTEYILFCPKVTDTAGHTKENIPDIRCTKYNRCNAGTSFPINYLHPIKLIAWHSFALFG